VKHFTSTGLNIRLIPYVIVCIRPLKKDWLPKSFKFFFEFQTKFYLLHFEVSPTAYVMLKKILWIDIINSFFSPEVSLSEGKYC